MSALYFLLPIALLLGGVFVGLFVWAVSRGQFDDLDDAPERMLHED
jgi:cbb3-type cytochrome oxidase maturation protein